MDAYQNQTQDGYTMKNGQFANCRKLNLSPAPALAADAYSPWVELGDHRAVSLFLDVTSVSASDTLDVTIQTSKDGVTAETAAVAAFTQATEVTSQWKHFTANRFIRAFFDVAGSAIAIDCTLTGECS